MLLKIGFVYKKKTCGKQFGMAGRHTGEPGSLVTSALSHPGSAITGRFTAPRRRSLEGACPHHPSAAAPEGRASTPSVPRHWLVFTPRMEHPEGAVAVVPLVCCASHVVEMAHVLRTIRLHLLCVPRVPMASHAVIPVREPWCKSLPFFCISREVIRL